MWKIAPGTTTALNEGVEQAVLGQMVLPSRPERLVLASVIEVGFDLTLVADVLEEERTTCRSCRTTSELGPT